MDIYFCVSCVSNVELNVKAEQLLGSYVHGDRRSENHLELKPNGEYIWKHTTHGQQDFESIIGSWSFNGKIIEFIPAFNAEGNLGIAKTKKGEIVLVPLVNVNEHARNSGAMQNQLDLWAFVRK